MSAQWTGLEGDGAYSIRGVPYIDCPLHGPVMKALRVGFDAYECRSCWGVKAIRTSGFGNFGDGGPESERGQTTTEEPS
jgi:hypothetical protein